MWEYSIGGIFIIDDNYKFIGIVINRDLCFEKNYSRKLEDIMIFENLVIVKKGIFLKEVEIIL